jgi:hypothetical protein
LRSWQTAKDLPRERFFEPVAKKLHIDWFILGASPQTDVHIPNGRCDCSRDVGRGHKLSHYAWFEGNGLIEFGYFHIVHTVVARQGWKESFPCSVLLSALWWISLELSEVG